MLRRLTDKIHSYGLCDAIPIDIGTILAGATFGEQIDIGFAILSC